MRIGKPTSPCHKSQNNKNLPHFLRDTCPEHKGCVLSFLILLILSRYSILHVAHHQLRQQNRRSYRIDRINRMGKKQKSVFVLSG